MYKELVALLRKKYGKSPLVMYAAYVIEELVLQNAWWEEAVKTILDYIPCWVPVSDHLPEDGEDVLCMLRNDAGDCYETVGCYNTTLKLWDLDAEWAQSRHVTHWMPLPFGGCHESVS